MLILITCMDRNNGIGKDNNLLAYLPKDLEHFKKTTTGQVCVFGRKTFESLPIKPLPNRETIILTMDDSFSHEGCKVVNGMDEILEMSKSTDVYVCGGDSVYSQLIPLADELIVSHVDEEFEADSYFPKIDPEIWIPYFCETIEDKMSFDIIKYKRRQKEND